MKNVIAATHSSLISGVDYDSSRAHRPGTRAIKDGSIKQQMVADCRERGMSYTETTLTINIDCIKHGRKTVGRSAVITCEAHMVHEVLGIEKRPQGNMDADSTWAKCRWR